MCELISLVISM